MATQLLPNKRHQSAIRSDARPKSVWLATVLNVVLPGVGLAYLGLWSWAAANFVVVQLVLATCFWIAEPQLLEHIHWVIMVCAVGSGSFAHSLAKLQR